MEMKGVRPSSSQFVKLNRTRSLRDSVSRSAVHPKRSFASDWMPPLNAAAFIDLSSAMLIAVEARYREVRHRVAPPIPLELAMLDSWPGRTII